MKAEVNGILDREDYSDIINNHERNMLMINKPNNWNVFRKGNLEIEMEVDFEKFMFAVSEHTNKNIDNITVFGFYSLTGYIKEKNVNETKNGGDNKLQRLNKR